MAEYPPEIFTQFGDPFDPSIMIERRTHYELQIFKKYGGSILKPFGIHPKYPYFHINITKLNKLPSSKIGVSQKKYGLKNRLDGTTQTTTPTGKKLDKLGKNIKPHMR
ncbi:hypothetical protein R3W88_033357 [Solanum pinnatisectum]|uniref:Uncharacterized protein n=1 Tax=Solanum pinnatisectum TaxID=50273 RepID=A0AAV9K317_9SOLN|nr:hypothetical protein R3W88_033357 [Solanum pinnatisectum]